MELVLPPRVPSPTSVGMLSEMFLADGTIEYLALNQGLPQ